MTTSPKPACHFQANSEHTRGEGIHWYVECLTHQGFLACPTLNYARKLQIQRGFDGRGAKQKADAALKRIQQLPEQMVHEKETP